MRNEHNSKVRRGQRRPREKEWSLLEVQMQCGHIKVLLHVCLSGSAVSNHEVLLDLLSSKADGIAQRVTLRATLFEELEGVGPPRGVFWALRRRRGVSGLEKHKNLSRAE